QRLKAVSQRNPAQCRHHQLVVINAQVRLLEVGRHLELAWGDFIVTGRNGHAQLVQLEFGFGDATLDTLGNSAEIVILELLAARRRGADESTTSHHQIWTQSEVRAIDQELLLL